MFLCKIPSSRGWKGRRIWYIDQQVQYKEISANIFSGAPRFAGVCWLHSGTDNARPVQPAVTSAVTNHNTARQQMENKPIQKRRMLQPEKQQRMILIIQEYRKEMQYNERQTTFTYLCSGCIFLERPVSVTAAAFRFLSCKSVSKPPLEQRGRRFGNAFTRTRRIRKQSFIRLPLNSKDILLAHPTNTACAQN